MSIVNKDILLVRKLATDLEKVAAQERQPAQETSVDTRKRLIATLEVILKFVHEITVEIVSNEITKQSHAAGLLNRLIIALRELDEGIVDEMFKTLHDRNKVLSRARVEQQEMARTMYKMLREKGDKNSAACYKFIAEYFGVESKKIKSWISNSNKPSGSKRRHK